MEKLYSFTALDFETLTGERSSACAIGLVKVVGGTVVQKFYSLINPIPDNRTKNNSEIHGITHDKAALAPTFQQLWPAIRAIIGSDPIVCHNSDFDCSVWFRQMEHYGCDDPDKYEFFCTYKATGLSLEDGCKEYGIEMGTHHDALDDALACASLMLAINGCPIPHPHIPKEKKSVTSPQKKTGKDKRKSFELLDDSLIVNKDTPFHLATVVYTGDFATYRDRNELGLKLQSLGAKVTGSISGSTDIVIIGSDPGPSKLKKVEEMRAKGHDIRIMDEKEFLEILALNNLLK